MSQEESGQGQNAGEGKQAADAFRDRLVAFLEERGVTTSQPVAEVRIADVATWWRVVQNLDAVVQSAGIGAPQETQAPDKEPPAGWKPHPAVEALAKAWERLRKAIGEMEAMCGQTEQSARMGLGSEMKPLIEQTRGVLESALVFGRKKRERAARKREGREGQASAQRKPRSTAPNSQDKTE